MFDHEEKCNRKKASESGWGISPFVGGNVECDVISCLQSAAIFNIIDWKWQKEHLSTLFITHTTKSILVTTACYSLKYIQTHTQIYKPRHTNLKTHLIPKYIIHNLRSRTINITSCMQTSKDVAILKVYQ